ncbi:unnamed protein product [Arctia plantaginis]|uniref:Pyruvate kinase n=1 Tax=Arctia plantaginis TaxID=874455 RepID=A0A8S1BHM0_ARCPL|nr:unnamed protein product [Arctia plantaginis]
MTSHANESSEVRKISDTDYSDPAVLSLHRPFQHRRTTIIVTFANPTVTLVDIHTIMETGMNVARFLPAKSTSHDKKELITKVFKAAKYLAKKHGMIEWPYATCIELKTCVVKTGILEQGSHLFIPADSEVTLTNDLEQYDKCNVNKIFVDNPYLTSETKEGMEVSIRQEAIIMIVKKILTDRVICTVIKAGYLKNLDSVCMRGAKRTRSYLSMKDLELAKLAMDNEVDMIIIQYARHPDTVKRLKKFLGAALKRTCLVCGICTNEGLRNVDDIIKEADGIIVSREYLPYELERKMMSSMDRIQKYIVGKCRRAGKPAYVSGQIFKSVFKTGKLNEQDATDVTHCLLQGVSGFLLKPCDNSQSTRNVIKELTSLCTEIEPYTNEKIDFRRIIEEDPVPLNAAMAAVTSCVMLVNETQAQMIIIPTVSGRTVYHLNSLRIGCLVLAVTTNIRSFRLMQIKRAVIPLLYNGSSHGTWEKKVGDRINFAVEYALNKNWLSYSNYYIALQKGTELSAYCDTVRILEVTTKKKELISCGDDDQDSS